MKFKITWITGYGESDGKSEEIGTEYICEDNGFNAYNIDCVLSLEVGKGMMVGGVYDMVQIDRLA